MIKFFKFPILKIKYYFFHPKGHYFFSHVEHHFFISVIAILKGKALKQRLFHVHVTVTVYLLVLIYLTKFSV